MARAKKAALGRGLNALLPDVPADASERRKEEELSKSPLYAFEDRVRLLGRVADIEVDHIRPNPYQPRTDFDEQALEELSASIQQLGIIQPITVRAMGHSKFEVISGERRLRAARRAGLKRVPAYVREADTEAMLEMALVENVQREELNPVEIALGYQRLIEECSLTQEQVAKKVSKSRSAVANLLRLLKLPPRLQAGLRDGTLTVGHARALVNVDDGDVQFALYKDIEEGHLTVRQVEERVRAWHKAQQAPPQETTPAPDPVPERDVLELQAHMGRLRTHLSTQVQVKHNAKTGAGRIEIAYYSTDDLERLMELLIRP